MNVWTITTAGVWLVDIRQDLDLQAGTALDYDGTLDAAYTLTGATLAADVDAGVALAISTLFLASAPEPVLIATALDAGLTPRAATYSRYTVRVSGAGEIPEGTTVQGGGPLGRSRWTAVSETATYANNGLIEIEANDAGDVSITSPATLSLVTPVTGVDALTYDSGDSDPFQVGRLAETPAELRARILARQAARTGSAAAIRSSLLDIPWVVAADVRRPAAGQLAITVAPGPVGDDQEAELGAAIYASISASAETTGSSSLDITDANGEASTVAYTAGTTEAVAVVIVLTLDGSVAPADAILAADASVREAFVALATGGSIYRLRVLGALDLPGVTAATLTLNGSNSAASVAPSNTANVLIPSPLTISVAA